ncbi:MAG: acetate--CoA ligase family protein [Alphaproteobacteria bacterium]|nr:acetate--CoA ligase family protein [Alphaproteobacteria bacterium]MBU1551315.1 acetate--CoA ligase family protein [Alphaproteobacteria bacterium]MBU2334750.1 acetate--CoA ligase family protein [Alphaproteobacteria bacterium]MBU2389253.1 acetate--CoA ligase family protein [Alphaproteobacteria bacterium]
MTAERVSALDALFCPASVAVVGASADPNKPGGRPVSYLIKHGFAGRIYPINPKVESVCGLPCYASVDDLPEAPDVAIVLLAAERAHVAVRQLAARGTRLAIVLASGFSEAGEAGMARQQALLDAAGTMRILGPNTIGAMDLTKNIVLSASGALEVADLPTGGISVASQSGGILGALLSRGAARGIGFCKLATTGNEVDIDLADLIDYYADDSDTQVIAAYVEGIRSVDRFRQAAEKARRAGKPVVVFKVGRSASGARAAVSHTGAMAGEDRVYDVLFRQCGIIRAQTFSDLLDVPAMLLTGRRVQGRGVAVLTSTGGAGSLVADSCGIAGLDVPLLDQPTAKGLAEILQSDEPMTANPVDVTLAGVKPDVMTAATEMLLASPIVDAVVVIVGSSALAQPEIVVGAIKNGAAKSLKPLIAYVSPYAPHIVRELNRQGIPAYTDPETCAVVLKATLPMPAAPAALVAPEVPVAPDGLPSGVLNEAQSRELFGYYGLTGTDQRIVQTALEATDAATALGGRVVLKVLSSQIAHKSDVGGVKVGLKAAHVGQALTDMAAALASQGLPKPEGFLVQTMLSGGVEVILGLRRDPQLGPLVLLGAGGIFAELADDSAIRLLPITEADARDMVLELRLSRILNGYRGGPRYDTDALVEAILSLARMGESLGTRLLEAEINPLFVMPKGEGVAAADALVVIE